MSTLKHKSLSKTINDIELYYKNGQLNLKPGFQRNSVWKLSDRKKLIESIIRNNPIPAIFLYKRTDNSTGKPVYDVIDGKQRIESILMFMGLLRGQGKYSVKTQFNENNDDKHDIDISWNYLKKNNQHALINDYLLHIIEVDGEFSDIIDLFIRINSTGKALTPAEKQHAKYYNSEFLKEAAKIADRYKDYFIKTDILSKGQIDRMKHVELICELMLSMGAGDVIHKKAALDKIICKGLSPAQITKQKKKIITNLNRIGKMFPKLRETRFRQISDFYTFAVLISKYEEQGFILTDKKKNLCAWNILTKFSEGVDRVREKTKKAEGSDESDNMYKEYLLTVTSNTDDMSQRKKRMDILDGLIGSIFATKDKQRIFSKEQRRIFWNSTEEKKCQICGKILTWDNFSIDHTIPHSKGGRSIISNAALMCKPCNFAKGNRTIKKVQRKKI